MLRYITAIKLTTTAHTANAAASDLSGTDPKNVSLGVVRIGFVPLDVTPQDVHLSVRNVWTARGDDSHTPAKKNLIPRDRPV